MTETVSVLLIALLGSCVGYSYDSTAIRKVIETKRRRVEVERLSQHYRLTQQQSIADRSVIISAEEVMFSSASVS